MKGIRAYWWSCSRTNARTGSVTSPMIYPTESSLLLKCEQEKEQDRKSQTEKTAREYRDRREKDTLGKRQLMARGGRRVKRWRERYRREGKKEGSKRETERRRKSKRACRREKRRKERRRRWRPVHGGKREETRGGERPSKKEPPRESK